jgi:dephospho-CoA kinase
MCIGTKLNKMKKLNNKWVTKTTETRLYNIPVPIIGLTGGIATGKTTVAELFRTENIPVIDADKLVKGIYQKKESFDFVTLHFLDAIIDNTIHFKTLRELAFKTPENQKKLEDFIYAQMPKAFIEAFATFSHPEFIVYDVPLLFEKGLYTKTDVSVCTYSPRAIQRDRLVKRDNISVDLANTILNKQMDIEEKKAKSNLFIENTGDLALLKKNFDELLSKLSI